MTTTIAFPTGRDYGAPQVLYIDLPDTTGVDDWSMVPVRFADAARNISGVVQLFAMTAHPAYAGPAVLAEYDAGRYSLI